MRIDFALIGAQKCGTTSLAAQLAAHPQVCFCKNKEPAFFNQTAEWRQRLDAYHRLYRPEPGQICGEGSTMYTFFPEWPETHERLHAYNPDLQLIYMMRHPVERILSHYTHRFLRNQVKVDPETAVLRDPTYLNRSRYAVQIRPYIELFGRENVKLLVFEEYVADQQRILQEVADFLQIGRDAFLAVDTKPRHKSVGNSYLKNETLRKAIASNTFQSVRDYIPASLRQAVRRPLANQIERKPEFSSSFRQLLWRFLEDDVYQIEQLMQRSITSWRQRQTI